MKSLFKTKNFLFFILFLLTTISAIFFYHVFKTRYYISEPMQDIEYKKAIIRDSHNIFYKLENLRPIVGETELLELIKNHNKNPQIYTPTKENIKQGIFKANLHMHTTESDGIASVKQRLDFAQTYAEHRLNGDYMYIAITDHNTILGGKEVVKILQKNPKKYKNIKVILGMEIYTAFNSKYSDSPIDIHVLTWCLNPYDKFLNQEFFKPKNANKYNRNGADRDFDIVIPMMSNYSIPGIAHPIRYTDKLGANRYLYFQEMMTRYRSLSRKPLFAEGYYQVYPRFYNQNALKKIQPYIEYVNKKADEYNIIKTGSTDSHSIGIFD